MSCNPFDEKCITIHNGIDLKPFESSSAISRETVGFTNDDFVLAFSGRLVPEKGIMELIEAMKSRAQELGERIRFTGYIEHKQLPRFLKIANAAVIPSTWQEPFGLTVVEAMAARLPLWLSKMYSKERFAENFFKSLLHSS